jgi:hypothetical protein
MRRSNGQCSQVSLQFRINATSVLKRGGADLVSTGVFVARIRLWVSVSVSYTCGDFHSLYHVLMTVTV